MMQIQNNHNLDGESITRSNKHIALNDRNCTLTISCKIPDDQQDFFFFLISMVFLELSFKPDSIKEVPRIAAEELLAVFLFCRFPPALCFVMCSSLFVGKLLAVPA